MIKNISKQFSGIIKYIDSIVSFEKDFIYSLNKYDSSNNKLNIDLQLKPQKIDIKIDSNNNYYNNIYIYKEYSYLNLYKINYKSLKYKYLIAQ